MHLPCVIDIEASGFGSGSYPIEIGFVTSAGTAHCTLVRPTQNWTYWNKEAEQLHGISRQLLEQKGKTVTLVASWLNDLLQGMTVYSDGWANDMCWLGKLFDEAGVIQQFRIESILMLLNEQEKECWTPVHNEVIGRCQRKRHRASLDAKNIQQTYKSVKS